jgi:hypothetical protein
MTTRQIVFPLQETGTHVERLQAKAQGGLAVQKQTAQGNS